MEVSLTGLYSALMRDMPISEYDRKYVLQRLAAEGLTFLTVELPKVSKAVLRSLEQGVFDRAELTSFRFNRGVLKFLKDHLSQVFDEKTGILLPSPNGAAIGTIRQLCEYSYKLAVPYSEEKKGEAKEKFLKNEEILHEIGKDPKVLAFANELRKDFETHWTTISSAHVSHVFREFRPRATNGTFFGCDELFFVERISSAADRSFPADALAFKGYYKPYAGLGAKGYMNRPVTEPLVSELLLVPKDSRGPRTICRETLKRVETQMAYFDFMVKNLTEISEGAINFLDQTVNRRIAEESSVSKEYATLDLKDASDMVSFNVMRTIFSQSPAMRWFFHGSRRATHVLVDGIPHKLAKVAGMGSGLTFPTMSLLISLAVCNKVKKRFGLRYEDIRKKVFIYGDDVCVPRQWYSTALDALACIGLRVNVDKSFVRGNFRESCGGDFFAGYDVTPCRIKLTNSKVEPCAPGRIDIADNAMAFKQLYEHAKELWIKNLTNASKYLMSVLDRFYTEKFSVKMMPGAFDEACDLPLNFTKGTGHLPADDSTVVYAIRPERISGLDRRKLISKKGRAYDQSGYNYLGSVLSATRREKGTSYPTAQQEAMDASRLAMERIDPQQPKTFGDVTIPRNLTFVKTEVMNQFYLKSFSCNAADELEKFHSTQYWNSMAELIFCQVFFSAYL